MVHVFFLSTLIVAVLPGMIGGDWATSPVTVLGLSQATSQSLPFFSEGFSDSSYGYMLPWTAGSKVARFDLATFSVLETLDLSQTDSDLISCLSGFSDGAFGYVLPWMLSGTYYGKVARFRMASFGDVQVLDVEQHDAQLVQLRVGFSDGTFGYIVPDGVNKVARFRLDTFGDVEVMVMDASLKGFSGGFVDGTYAYLVPFGGQGARHGKLTRFTLATFGSVTFLDLPTAHSDAQLVGFGGGFASATHGFLVPYASLAGFHGKIVKFDFATFGGSLAVLDAASGDSTLKPFWKGFTDGTYGYIRGADNNEGRLVRFPLESFDDVEVMDLNAKDSDIDKIGLGFAHGGFGYAFPRDSGRKVARFDVESSWSAPVAALDLSTALGADTVASFSGFAAQGHGYVAPSAHGRLSRFSLSTLGDVEILDLSAADAGLTGFYGGYSDGTYGYLAPKNNGKVPRFRLDTFGDVEVLDLTAKSGDLTGPFISGFSDGSYGYLSPNGVATPKVVRFNLRTFSASDVETLDLATTDSSLKGFTGAFSDGTYGYLVPYLIGSTPQSKVVRFTLANFGSVQVLDVAATNIKGTLSPNTNLKGFLGGFTDGSHGYLVPRYNGAAHGLLTRFDLSTFNDVEVLDLSATDQDLRHFVGGFTDGTYGYVLPSEVPTHSPSPGHMSKVGRFRLQTFDSVQVLDLGATDAKLKLGSGGFSDGRFGYMVPGNDNYPKVARFPVEPHNHRPPTATTSTATTTDSSTSTTASSTSSSATESSTSSTESSTSSTESSTSSTSASSTSSTESSTSSTESSTSSVTESSTSTAEPSSSTSRSTITESSTSSTESSSSKPSSWDAAESSTTSTLSATPAVVSSSTGSVGTSASNADSHSGTSVGPGASSFMTSRDASTSTAPGTAAESSGRSAVDDSTSPQMSLTEVPGPVSTSSMRSPSELPQEPGSAVPTTMAPVTSSLATANGLWHGSTEVSEAGLGIWTPATPPLRSPASTSMLEGQWAAATTASWFTSAEAPPRTSDGVEPGKAAPKTTQLALATPNEEGTTTAAATAAPTAATTAASSQEPAGIEVAALLGALAMERKSLLADLAATNRVVTTRKGGGGTAAAIDFAALLLELNASSAAMPRRVPLPVPAEVQMEASVPTSLLLRLAEEEDPVAFVVSPVQGSKAAALGSAPPPGQGGKTLDVLGVASIDFLRISSSERLPVSGLEEPIEFTLPANYTPEMQCAYWDEQKEAWSSEGVEVSGKSRVGKDIVCATYHLSLFGAIIQGFLETLLCANFNLLNREAVREIFRGAWVASLGAMMCCCLLAVMALLFLAAAAVDRRRLREMQWKDEYFLLRGAEAQQQAAQQATQQTVALALPAGCLSSCAECIRGSSAMRDALDDIVSNWFSCFSELRSCLEGVVEGCEVGLAECSLGIFKKLGRDVTLRLLLILSRRLACSRLRMSEDMVIFVMNDSDLSDLLMEEYNSRSERRAHGIKTALEPASGQREAWASLHREVSHHLVMHTNMLTEQSAVKAVLCLFVQSNPLASAFSLDVFYSCKERVMLLAVDIFGALALSCLFFEAAGLVRGKPVGGQSACDGGEGAGYEIGRFFVIALGSLIFAGIPVMLLESLQTKGFRRIDATSEKRQLRVWELQGRLFWAASTLTLGCQVFYSLLFLANIGARDDSDWAIAGLLAVLQDYLAIPICAALFLPLLALLALLLHSRASASSASSIIRAAAHRLHNDTNIMLPLVQT